MRKLSTDFHVCLPHDFYLEFKRELLNVTQDSFLVHFLVTSFQDNRQPWI